MASEERAEAGGSADEMRRRIEELEQKLTKVSAERDEYRKAAYEFLGQLIPYEPVTEEELQVLMHGPRGRQIADVLAEFQADAEADGGR